MKNISRPVIVRTSKPDAKQRLKDPPKLEPENFAAIIMQPMKLTKPEKNKTNN